MNKYDPFQHAEILGVGVEWEHLPHDLHGLWTGRCVLLDPRLSARQARCALAHELVHVELDEPILHTSYAARIESRCDRLASKRLIDAAEYQQLASIYPDNLPLVALELDVTQPMLEAYIKNHA